MTAPLRDALHHLGDQIPPARLPNDLWRRGRRQRYHKTIITAVIVLLGVAAALIPGLHVEPRPADGGAAVPANVELPYFWQATVDMDPPGTASLLFGGDSLGLSSDPFEEEGDKLAVVGRGGDYRMLRYPGEGMRAGQDVRLSPDGTLVAQSWLNNGPDQWLIVTDLRTGKNRGYGGMSQSCCFEIAAWRPDGGAVLVLHRLDRADVIGTSLAVRQPSQYILVDLKTGALARFPDIFEQSDVQSAWTAAFAPDGRHLALTVPTPTNGTVLRGYDTTGRQLWTRDLGGARHLAGAGAYTPDGKAIATITLDGCVADCDRNQLNTRNWSVSYLDAATGADVAGPSLPAVRGPAVRALGWHRTDLIVVQYEPETDMAAYLDDTGWLETGHVRVLALHPDGSTSVLLDPPDDVSSIDIAADLIRNGQFGGPVPSPSIFRVRWSVIAQGSLCTLVPLLLLAFAMGAVIRRTRRSRRRKGAEVP